VRIAIALSLVLLPACLPPAPPDPPTGPEGALHTETPLYSQADLHQSNAYGLFGRFEGSCAGKVILQIRTPDEPRPLAQNIEPGPGYTIALPPGDNLYLRYGCDADGDGTVAAADAQTVRIGTASRLPPLLLLLPSPPGDAKVTLLSPTARSPNLPPPPAP
jgi:hypothetical protein